MTSWQSKVNTCWALSNGSWLTWRADVGPSLNKDTSSKTVDGPNPAPAGRWFVHTGFIPTGADRRGFAHQRSFRFVSRKVGVLRRGLAAVAEVVEEAAGSDIGFNTVGH